MTSRSDDTPTSAPEAIDHQQRDDAVPLAHGCPCGCDSVQQSNDLMALAGTNEDVLGHLINAPKMAENRPVPIKDSNRPRRDPLLGTICSQSIENARGSSKRRSPESLCYTKLLHNSDPGSASIPQNSGKNGRRSFSSPWASMRGEMRRSFWPLP